MQMNNYLENDAIYVYNYTDPSKYKYLLSLIFPVTKKLTIRLNYTNEEKLLKRQNQNQTYYQQSIIAGLSWKL